MNEKKSSRDLWSTLSIVVGSLTIFISWIVHDINLDDVQGREQKQQFYYSCLLSHSVGQQITALMSILIDADSSKIYRYDDTKKSALVGYIHHSLRQMHYAADIMSQKYGPVDTDDYNQTQPASEKNSSLLNHEGLEQLYQYLSLLENELGDTSLKIPSLDNLKIRVNILHALLAPEMNTMVEQSVLTNLQYAENDKTKYIWLYAFGSFFLALGFIVQKWPSKS
jgi:hypothetical protein